MPVHQPFEATLAAPFTASGRGLHTGRSGRITVEPAPERHGLRFLAAGAEPVALSHENRVSSRFNTALGLSDGTKLRTIEHLAAGLSAFGIDNALVRVEGRELPIFDGSARPWCERIAQAGIAVQRQARRSIRITRAFQVASNGRFVRAEPTEDDARPGLWLDVTCEPFYGRGTQRWRGPFSREAFLADIADSRSSGQVSRLWEFGPVADRLLAPLLRPIGGLPRAAAGEGSAANAPVPNIPLPDLPSVLAPDIAERMRNPAAREPVLRGLRPGRAAIHLGPFVLGGARFPDERVRHNALDLIGDLRLAGSPLIGRIVTHRPTHKLTYAFVASLMRETSAWTYQTA